MTWGFVAAGAAVVVGSVLQTDAQNDMSNSQGKAANNSAYKNYTNSVRQTMENNRAIGEANTVNMIRAGYKVGLLNLQTARLKEQAAQEGWNTSRKAAEVLGSAEANAAASGTVGASVSAVSLDIRKKSDEAQIGIDANWYHTLENQNIGLDQVIQEAQDRQMSVQSIPDISTVNTVNPPQASAFGAAAGGLLNLYAGSQMNLGAGSKSAPTTTANDSYSYSSVLNGVSGSYRLTN